MERVRIEIRKPFLLRASVRSVVKKWLRAAPTADGVALRKHVLGGATEQRQRQRNLVLGDPERRHQP